MPNRQTALQLFITLFLAHNSGLQPATTELHPDLTLITVPEGQIRLLIIGKHLILHWSFGDQRRRIQFK